MSKNIKLTSRYTVFEIYEDKSHYPSAYNVLRKKQSYVRRIYIMLNLVRRFKKQSDLSLYEYKFDLSYCQWNTREPSVVLNVSFLMFSL